MAFLLNDRVKETTTSTGTGTVNLAGAETGFDSFVSGIGNSNTTYYAIVHQTADEFEVGIGTVTDATPDTLSRTTIISSSNSDAAVNFSSGTKDVFCTLPASKAVFFDESSGSSDVSIGSRGTNPMGLSMVGTVLALTEQTNVASFQMDGAQASRIDMGSGPGTRQFVIYTDTANYSSLERKDAKPILFATDNTERLRITAAGNVGVGVSAPANVLQVKTTVDGSGLTIQRDSTTAGTYGQLSFINTTTDNYTAPTWIRAYRNAAGVNAGEMTFGTAGSERMRINGTNGNVGIGNTSPSVALGVTGAIIASDNITAYGTPSDIRLKENIKVIDNALDKVKQLKGITYDLKSDGNRLTGLIAQDLEKVLPEAVYETSTVDDASDKHLAIRYGNTVGLLVEAIKEQQEQIETLTAKVKELEVKE
jgi:hypothetical protein